LVFLKDKWLRIPVKYSFSFGKVAFEDEMQGYKKRLQRDIKKLSFFEMTVLNKYWRIAYVNTQYEIIILHQF
jgi:hypothetical protein